MVEPDVVHGSEIWSMTEKDVVRLSTWQKKILRRIWGPVAEHGMWRIRSVWKLRSIYTDWDTVAVADTHRKVGCRTE